MSFYHTKKRSWFHSPFVTVLLLLAVIWGCVAVFKAYGKEREAAGLRDQSIREESDLASKQTDLSSKVQTLSTEDGMEAEVRERYRVVKPGEQLVIVVDDTSTSPVPSPHPTLWQRIRSFIGL